MEIDPHLLDHAILERPPRLEPDELRGVHVPPVDRDGQHRDDDLGQVWTATAAARPREGKRS